MKKISFIFFAYILCATIFNGLAHAGPAIDFSRIDLCIVTVDEGIQRAKMVMDKIGAKEIKVDKDAVFGIFSFYSVAIIPIKVTGGCSLIFLATGDDLYECSKLRKQMQDLWWQQ